MEGERSSEVTSCTERAYDTISRTNDVLHRRSKATSVVQRRGSRLPLIGRSLSWLLASPTARAPKATKKKRKEKKREEKKNLVGEKNGNASGARERDE